MLCWWFQVNCGHSEVTSISMLLLHLLQVRSSIQVGLEGGGEEEEVFAIVSASCSCAAESWWHTTSSGIVYCCFGCSSGHVRDPSNGSFSTDVIVGRLLTLEASHLNPKLWLVRELFPTVLAGDNATCCSKFSNLLPVFWWHDSTDSGMSFYRWNKVVACFCISPCDYASYHLVWSLVHRCHLGMGWKNACVNWVNSSTK